jgi:hypothetical protein
MTSDGRIRAMVESFYRDIWDHHDKTRIPELLHSDFTYPLRYSRSRRRDAEGLRPDGILRPIEVSFLATQQPADGSNGPVRPCSRSTAAKSRIFGCWWATAATRLERMIGVSAPPLRCFDHCELDRTAISGSALPEYSAEP